ncbi:HmuY family protein [Flavobacteriaceae bacterium M23B6Z8]
MKIFKTLLLAGLTAIITGACSSDDEGPRLEAVESQQISNLHAPQQGGQGEPISGAFTKFDFSTGQITTSETEWDIAFRGTTIIVNGGTSLGTTDEPDRNGNAAAYIASGTFASVTEVDDALFKQDSGTGYAIPSGSGNGWYLYNPQAFLITPIAGKILVFRTRDNRFAKVEILSYYENAPENPDVMVDEGRYYTFNYVYQPNAGINTF